MKGLVTFSLYGSDLKYHVGALQNTQIWKESPFDVDLRFYCGNSVSDDFIDTLLTAGAQVVLLPSFPEDHTATFWRFDVFNENSQFRFFSQTSYDYILSRDTDSRPFEREFYAIDEWLRTTYPFHMIRDHPFHGVPVLAGLFGVKRDLFPMMSTNLPWRPPENFYLEVNRKFKTNHVSNNFYQVDQYWLRFHLYHMLRNRVLAHDSFFGFERKRHRRQLPPYDSDFRFCGEGFTELDLPRYPEHRDLIRERLNGN